MIPTARTFKIGLLALAVILIGRGSPWSTALAWTVAAVALTGWLADAALAALRPRLSLHRQAPGQLHVGQPHTIRWVIENRSPFAVELLLRDQVPAGSRAEPEQLRATVAAGSRLLLAYCLRPGRRGDGQFGDLTYRIAGPMGLAWWQSRLAAGHPVRCLPHLANWKAAELAERSALARQSGSHRYRWRGAGTVFESLREYSPEDDIRWLDWKATARRHRPISRNYEVERHQQVLLVLDGSRSMTTYCGSRTKFDVVLEAAVLAARSAADQGDAVGLVLFSDKMDLYLHPRRQRGQVGAVMDALYRRQPRLVEPDFQTALTLAAQRARRRSLIILFSDVTVIESARRMATYVRSLIPRHLPLVVTIADQTVEQWEVHEPRGPEELYQVGVANELVQQRAALLEQLRRSGAAVLEAPADHIALHTVDAYLQLKRRLRL